jgi:cell wall-associated NlpC family hydrolase
MTRPFIHLSSLLVAAPARSTMASANALVTVAMAAIAVALALGPNVSFAAETRGDEPSSTSADNPPSTMRRIEKNLRKAVDGASEISSIALSLIGVDYKFGGNTPDQGLDCSGFVRYVFQQATGINLPRTSREQAKIGQSVSKDQLQPGDLVFFNTRRFQFSHVGVYLGDNRFVHSPSRGGSVEIVDLDNKYWTKAFNGARRVLGSVVGTPVYASTIKPMAVASSGVLSNTSTLPTQVVAEPSGSTKLTHPPGGPAWVGSAGDY